MSVRALNCLKANDITKIGQLLGKREDELLSPTPSTAAGEGRSHRVALPHQTTAPHASPRRRRPRCRAWAEVAVAFPTSCDTVPPT
ncbi:MAG TPA: DNA-directed RNA polymerase subunit alpha C-terminal domain-containing protein [Gaiellaceae bacterium]